MIFKRLLFVFLAAFFMQAVFATEEPLPEVVFETTLGNFTMELYPEDAPKTVTNFLNYVDKGFYKGTLFHRVIPRFMVQGGGFEKGMKKKPTGFPVKNESNNGLKNIRGAVSMARTSDPHSATSQFFINDRHNLSLDYQDEQPGYTVFGKVTEGMDVIGKIIRVPTTTSDTHKDVPKDDVVILSAKRKGSTSAQGQERFIAGEHYVVLDKPVATRDGSKIEVVEMFSYGCPHCYEFEPLIKHWGEQQASDVDFWFFPAVWNEPMKLYARAFYAAQELDVAEKIHHPLFTAIVIEQKNVSNEKDLADFFAKHGVDKTAFTRAFNSTLVKNQVKWAEARVHSYKPASVPEIVVNGKYRIDRMRAGGQTEMLAVADYLIHKERALLNK